MRLSFGVGGGSGTGGLTADLTDMCSSVKKKLIHKIRNRMSAQRSRMKQRVFYKNMEANNKFLVAKNNQLSIDNTQLIYENAQLRKELFEMRQFYEKKFHSEDKSEAQE